ncbi:MAG: hypothetical protein JXQ83_14850 [Candidatus Glassbacteria bacterium]|nr:hypothetical protein [Candidatus Glassbacteria bacterium]
MEEFLSRLDSVPFLLPLAIACLRIIDVSIGTVRMILVIRGRRLFAAVLGFFEVIVWLTAITGILSHITDWINVVAYGVGFALGNVVGIYIEGKMAVGQQVIRFISTEHGDRIIRILRSKGYGVTEVVASGREGPVGLGFVIVARKKVPGVVGTISGIDPAAVVTVGDVRQSNIVEYHSMVGGNWWRMFFKKK